MATLAARLLQGKHKPTLHARSSIPGDHVVVVNAERVKLTGRKEEQKLYRAPQRLRGRPAGRARQDRPRSKAPIRLVEEAVRGMLPKTKMGDAMYRKLRCTPVAEHPHAAQKPSKIEVA